MTGVLVGVAGVALTACGTAGSAAGPAASPSRAANTKTNAKPAHSAALTGATGTSNCTGATVTATGSGTVEVAPDDLSVTLDVHTQAVTAAGALRDNNNRARALITTLKKAGVANSDIQTTGLSIYPTYSRPKGKPATIDGYEVNNTVTAQILKLSSAGKLVDQAVAQVGKAVRLDGISFSLQNPDAAEASAHTKAVQAAMSQAQSMATAAGSTLGPLCSVSDVSNGDDEGFSTSTASAGGAGGAGSPVPIESGSEQVSAQVRVVYTVSS